MKTLIVLFLSLILLSCSTSEVLIPQKKCLRLSFSSDPMTLDTRKSGDFITSQLLFNLFSGLTELQADGTITLALAESFTLSEDKKIFTFFLKDCHWSDGKKITAFDFEKSWKKILDPSFAAPCPHLLYSIKNAEAAAIGKLPLEEVAIHAKDEKTLVVELERPTSYFLALTSFCTFFPLPSHKSEEDSYIGFFKKETSFVGSGPFLLLRWKHHDELLLKKNPFYWNEKEVKLEYLHISILPNATTALQMFEKKELDLLGTYASPLPLDSLTSLRKKAFFHLIPIGGTSSVYFHTGAFPFNHFNFRKAFSAAIDREALTQNITLLKEPIASRFLPPVLMQGKNRKILENNQPLLAKKYLKKGLKELSMDIHQLEITLSYAAREIDKKLACALKEQWEKVLGVSIKLELVEEKAMLEKLYKRDFQLALSRLFVYYPDATDILERFRYRSQSKNYSSWENPAYRKILQQIAESQESKERDQAIEEAEDFLASEMVFAPIFHFHSALVVHPYLKGWRFGLFGDLHLEKAHFVDP